MANALQMVPDAATRALVITMPDGSKETYAMTEAPPDTSSLVNAAKQDVLHDLSLEGILTDLDRSVDLMFLAYCGVAGSTIQADVNDRQTELMNLCGECVIQMTGFRTASTDVIARAVEAFEYLLEAKEERALEILSHCGSIAKKMSDTSARLEAGFTTMAESTKQSAHATLVAQGTQANKIEELREEHDKMEATLASLTQSNTDLAASVAELQRAYDEAKERETKADERAFMSGIISGITSALGAGVGAFLAVKNPLATAAASLSKKPDGETTPGSGASGDDAELGHGKSDGAAAKKAVDDAAAAVDAATKELDSATAAVAAAQKEVDAQKSAKDEALNSNSQELPELESALEHTQKALGDAQARASAAGKAKTDVDRALSDAKSRQSHDAAATGVAAGMGNVAETTRKMMDDAKTASDSIRQEKMKLLDSKLQLEKQKREVNAEMAKLAKSLGFNAEQKVDFQGTLNALEMAVWAFANIAVALANAKLFWANMATFCDRLASSNLLDKLKEEKKSADTPDERKAYYLGKHFMPTAVFYLARWVALNSISQDYLDAASVARQKSTKNIATSPSIEQARKGLQALKDKIAHQLDLDKLKSNQRSDEVMGEMKLLAGR